MYSLPNLHKLSCASKSRFDNVDAELAPTYDGPMFTTMAHYNPLMHSRLHYRYRR